MAFIDHLRRSAQVLFPTADGAPDARQGEYVERFTAGAPPQPRRRNLEFGEEDSRLVLTNADRLLRAEGFDTHGGPNLALGTLEARLSEDLRGDEDWLAWVPRNQRALSLVFDVRLEADRDGCRLFTSQALPSWAADFEQRLMDVLAATPPYVRRLMGRISPDRLGEGPAEDVLLVRPGEPLREAHDGQLLDYSGCADRDAVKDLETGDLPLGRHAFGFPGRDEEAVDYGADLYLGNYRTGAPMMFNGALICAPQNSGKTRLIMRWAKTANAAGHSVLLVDVKGDLHAQLAPDLKGRVYHFSTDPRMTASDGVNFLAGLDGGDAESLQRVRQLVDAILPKDGWEHGEQAYFHQNHTNWLTGLIQILLLYQHYYPQHFVGGEADLAFVYDMAASEEGLYRVMNLIRVAEAAAASPRQPGLSYWANEISLLIAPVYRGQRTADYAYRTLTQSITNALRPFSVFGTLYEKTSRGRIWRPATRRDRRFFTFDALNDPNEPVTIILAAREQDVDDATTMVSLVVKRLQHTLFDRMAHPGSSRAILLLLDETRRIRSFAPDEYITFARQARAGCVVVYQSLDQIGDDKKIRVILENVGAQIYLGSLVGETARHFQRMLPQRRRRSSTSTVSGALSGEISSSVQTAFETVDYLGAAELYRLPAGEWPALVYLNSQPRRDPILVDTDEAIEPRSPPTQG